MIDAILRHVHTSQKFEWVAGREELSFIQIIRSRGKRYERGRVVYAIFSGASPEPVLYAKISRDPSFDTSLKNEYEILNSLRAYNDSFLNRTIPTGLDLPKISDRLVLFETALNGRTMLQQLDSSIDTLDPTTRWELTKMFLDAVATWLIHLWRVTSSNAAVLDENFLQETVDPVIESCRVSLEGETVTERQLIGLRDKLMQFQGQRLRSAIVNGNLAPLTILFDRSRAWLGVVDWKFAQRTRLLLREHYCFASYLFFDLFARGFLGNGDLLSLWRKTFIGAENFLGNQIRSFFDRLHAHLGIDEKLGELFFSLYLINEMTVQMEYRWGLPGRDSILEGKFLQEWLRHVDIC